MDEVNVVIGPGSIGQAIARQENAAAARTLGDAGFDVSATTVDIASRESIRALLKLAASMGEVAGLVHAAGVSPSQAAPETILKVDLYGTAVILEEFGSVIARGGSGVVIASQSGHRLPGLSPGQNQLLASTPADDLLALPMLQPDQVEDLLYADQISKRCNALLMGPDGGFITGSDFLVDGNVTASYWFGELAPN